jgi:hypothetical protein
MAVMVRPFVVVVLAVVMPLRTFNRKRNEHGAMACDCSKQPAKTPHGGNGTLQ